MMYEVLSNVRLRVDGEVVECLPGQIINLRSELAVSLIEGGKVRDFKDSVERQTIKEFGVSSLALIIESSGLGEKICFAANDKIAKEMEREGYVAYTPNELEMLIHKNPSPEELKGIHAVKAVFSGSRIVE